MSSSEYDFMTKNLDTQGESVSNIQDRQADRQLHKAKRLPCSIQNFCLELVWIVILLVQDLF